MMTTKQKRIGVDIAFSKHFKPLFDRKNRYIVYYGGRGSGKSYNIARALILRAYAGELRVLCCREIQKSIEDSVYMLLRDQIHSLGLESFFEIQKTQIIGRNGSRFIFAGLKANVTSIKSKEGLDVVWVEEAENVSRDSWETLIPTIRKENSQIIASFNPKNILDDTYQRFVVNPPANCTSIQLNWQQNKYFPEVLRVEMEQMRERDYDLYLHVYEGQPVADSDLAIIKPSWIQASIDAHIKLGFEAQGKTVLGLDIADEGKDANACVVVHGSVVQYVESWKKGDVITTADKALLIAQQHSASDIVYDSIGVGAGVKAHYNRNGGKIRATGFNAGSKVNRPESDYLLGKKNKDMFANLKAQAWWQVRDRFYKTYRAIQFGDKYDPSELISLPKNLNELEFLIAELSRPQIREDGAGRIIVESKADMKKRGIPSPNLADSLIMAMYGLDGVGVQVWDAL